MKLSTSVYQGKACLNFRYEVTFCLKEILSFLKKEIKDDEHNTLHKFYERIHKLDQNFQSLANKNFIRNPHFFQVTAARSFLFFSIPGLIGETWATCKFEGWEEEIEVGCDSTAIFLEDFLGCLTGLVLGDYDKSLKYNQDLDSNNLWSEF